jgi:hypothetical protein
MAAPIARAATVSASISACDHTRRSVAVVERDDAGVLRPDEHRHASHGAHPDARERRAQRVGGLVEELPEAAPHLEWGQVLGEFPVWNPVIP